MMSTPNMPTTDYWLTFEEYRAIAVEIAELCPPDSPGRAWVGRQVSRAVEMEKRFNARGARARKECRGPREPLPGFGSHSVVGRIVEDGRPVDEMRPGQAFILAAIHDAVHGAEGFPFLANVAMPKRLLADRALIASAVSGKSPTPDYLNRPVVERAMAVLRVHARQTPARRLHEERLALRGHPVSGEGRERMMRLLHEVGQSADDYDRMMASPTRGLPAGASPDVVNATMPIWDSDACDEAAEYLSSIGLGPSGVKLAELAARLKQASLVHALAVLPPNSTATPAQVSKAKSAARSAAHQLSSFVRELLGEFHERETASALAAYISQQEAARPSEDTRASGGTKNTMKKRASAKRMQTLVPKLRTELARLTRDARAHAKGMKDLTGDPALPKRPTQKELAIRLGVSESMMSRCFGQNPGLRQAYDNLCDLNAVYWSAQPVQCPDCGETHGFRCQEDDCAQRDDGRCEECHREVVHKDIAPREKMVRDATGTGR